MASETPTRTPGRVRRGLVAALPVLVALHSHPASGDEPDYDGIMDAMFDTKRRPPGSH